MIQIPPFYTIIGFQDNIEDKEIAISSFMEELQRNCSVSHYVLLVENDFAESLNELQEDLEKFQSSTEINEEFVK